VHNALYAMEIQFLDAAMGSGADVGKADRFIGRRE
jgi:hypothetical protein